MDESNSTTSTSTTNTKKKWSSTSYPYKVDYNDHFETPIRAYEDILPLLDLAGPQQENQNNTSPKNKKKPSKKTTSSYLQKKRKPHILYDPYYCNGQTTTLLQKLNFTTILHSKRDFYKDIENNTIPQNYHTFLTNPPYSSNHKERCLEFAIQQLHSNEKCFFLLMPNYIATKDYFCRLIQQIPNQMLYIIPHTSYQYTHPQGTGYEISPFDSIWFCGVRKDMIPKVRQEQRELFPAGNNSISIYSTLEELKDRKLVPTITRGNPAQRRRRKKQLLLSISGMDDVDTPPQKLNFNKGQKTLQLSNSTNKTKASSKKRLLESNKDDKESRNPKKKKKKRY